MTSYAKRLLCTRVDARALFAELLGTALFVYSACGIASIVPSPVASSGYGVEPFRVALLPDLVAHGGLRALAALGFGLAVVVLAYALGHVSGCHLNPSVSLALWLSGTQPPPRRGVVHLLGCVAAQCAGSLLGAAALLGTAPGGSLGANVVAANVTSGSALLGETIMSGLLCLVVLLTVATAENRGAAAPVAIGLAVFLGNALLIPLDGASLNFARSLGPAVVSGEWSTVQYGSTAAAPLSGPGRFWIFALGPLLGALAAVPVWWALQPWRAAAEPAVEPSEPAADSA